MKKIYTLLLSLLVFSAVFAQGFNEMRIYINPGHGSWGPNDRPMRTIPYPFLASTGRPDTCGFYESNTNLWKCLKLGATLIKVGAKPSNIFFSRVKNGPYPYVAGASDEQKYNKALSAICAEVNANNIDFFISVHSNAMNNNDANLTNYPLYLYRGLDGAENAYNKGSYEVAQAIWPYGYDNDLEVWTGFSLTRTYVKGDGTFYGTNNKNGYLGVLKHNTPGFLVEGYFHDYQPARHRALNKDYCGIEGVRYAHGIIDYFGGTPEKTGYIVGYVKDKKKKIVNSLFTYVTGTDDQYYPLNGAVVTLKRNGNIIDTYTVDNNYNGVFVFENLDPGVYSLEVTAEGYKEVSESNKLISVQANEITYKKIFLESENGFSEPDVIPDYPDPKQDDDVTLKSEYTMRTQYLSKGMTFLNGMQIRRSILRKGKLYILALDAANKPYIYVVNPDTQTLISTISTQGTQGGTYALSDIAFTADDVLLGCNYGETQFADEYVTSGQSRGIFRVYKWVDETKDPEELFNSQYSAFYFNALTGVSMAVSGALNNCTILTSCRTIYSSNFRYAVFKVVDGIKAQEICAYNNDSSLNENIAGNNVKFAVSPLGEERFVIDGDNMNPIEFTFPPVDRTNVIINGQISTNHLGAKSNNATYFKYAGRAVMVAPEFNSIGYNTGVILLDVTRGFNYATKISTPGTTMKNDMSKFSMAAGVVDNADITIYCQRNMTVSRFTTKAKALPVIASTEPIAEGLKMNWNIDMVEVQKFNLYLDNALVSSYVPEDYSTESQNFVYTNLSYGNHTLGISVTYTDGNESDKVTTTVDYASVDNITDDSKQVYITPNPTNGMAQIYAPDEIETVKVYTMTGNLVFESNEELLDITNYASGVYIVKVNNYPALKLVKK